MDKWTHIDSGGDCEKSPTFEIWSPFSKTNWNTCNLHWEALWITSLNLSQDIKRADSKNTFLKMDWKNFHPKLSISPSLQNMKTSEVKLIISARRPYACLLAEYILIPAIPFLPFFLFSSLLIQFFPWKGVETYLSNVLPNVSLILKGPSFVSNRGFIITFLPLRKGNLFSFRGQTPKREIFLLC